jgi:hypothetical protein
MLNGAEPEPVSARDAHFEAVIGEQAKAYYLAYFRRAEARGYAPIAWHWPALFIPLPWLLYRKHYFWAFIWIAYHHFAVLCELLLDSVAPGLGQYLFVAMVGVFQLAFMPLFANAIYYRFARQLIESAKALHPGREQQLEYLRARGGASFVAPIIAFTVLLLLASLAQQGAGA